MELETGYNKSVYERFYHLPESLQESYEPGFCGPFGYEDQDSPPQILWDLPRLPHVLDDVHQAHLDIRLGGGSLISHQGMPPVSTVLSAPRRGGCIRLS